ncbi:helix-turn-helix domain-containing protein [uncultured Lactobacillus sp.]|uniref:helix-turn-helix domain-containing protein n=1 Tax=uncultured Lactobacillus sp. TaxID=153152 RepID=UPI002621A6D1|nr:helix-turn-helix transcriptional regulator [uncultured Lactobacillus sp.]
MNNKFATQLTKYRKRHGLSQDQLAQELNVSRQSVSKWENGTALPDVERIIDIATLLDVSLDTLLLDKENAPTEDVSKQISNLNAKLGEFQEDIADSHIIVFKNKLWRLLKRYWWIGLIFLIIYALVSYMFIEFLKYVF